MARNCQVPANQNGCHQSHRNGTGVLRVLHRTGLAARQLMLSTYALATLLLQQLDQHGHLDWNNLSHDNADTLVKRLAERILELHDTAELLCNAVAGNLQQISDVQRILRED